MGGGTGPSMLLVGQLLVFGAEAMHKRAERAARDASFFSVPLLCPFGRFKEPRSFSIRLHVQDSDSGSMMRPYKCRRLSSDRELALESGRDRSWRIYEMPCSPAAAWAHQSRRAPLPHASSESESLIFDQEARSASAPLLRAITIPCPNRPR